MSATDSLPGAAAAILPGEAVRFDAPNLLDWLEAASANDLDVLRFGLIAMAPDGIVQAYNTFERKRSGLSHGRVIGRHFFISVAPCTNNFLIALRFETEPELDAMLDYVFTFRMAPQRVRLRLLKHPRARRIYLAVEDRA
jgi:photoactive yellow protein